MSSQMNLKHSLLCAVSLLALTGAAQAQQAAGTETVVVTGSRVITDIANSPTPITAVTTQQLEVNTPTNIQDGLNKLPIFRGSSTPASNNNASNNNAGNVLGLRTLGAQRTLVLFDGHRVAPSNSNGTVDTDVLPQMLMSRVDVVTGGASAVYGSDAVTGVVNFVIDKHFEGIKYNANAGLSTYGDGAQYQFGIAAGTDLFGGKAHIEGSLRHYASDPVLIKDRPFGPFIYNNSGSGTAAAPFTTVVNTRLSNFSFGGKITCTGTTANPCTANNQQFIADGVIGPFNPGVATTTNNISSGGDGAYTTVASLIDSLHTDDAFARASYNVDDTTTAYVQLTAAQSTNHGHFQNNYIQVGTVPDIFFKNNPYLPAAAQAILAGGTTTTFTLAKYIANQGQDQGFITNGQDAYYAATIGLDGTLMGKYDWDLFYTHGDSRVKVDNPSNQNNEKMYAAEDAVMTPTGIACFVSTTTSASRFPGCVPMNPFGPTAMTTGQYRYWTQDSNFVLSQTLDDMGGSISGEVFDLPAGPIKAALSGEYREGQYQVASNALPTDTIDCTGLRLCNNAASYWQGNIANNQPLSTNNVWEFAVEGEAPLLKDLPLVQSLSLNMAGRYTNYSTSGGVETWKLGLVYHMDDNFMVRATNSVDIRAPTLNDLFSPIQITHLGYTDIHTGNTNGTTTQQTQGNANLVPEVSRTYTAGLVFTPTFIPGLVLSTDYYNVTIKNAIGALSGNSTVTQGLCETAGGTGIYCGLFVRPLPFSNTTSANYPTTLLSTSLNTAFNTIEGWDFEANYHFDMADISDALDGSTTFRLLGNYQPVQETVSVPGAAITPATGAKTRFTAFANYSLGNWTFSLEDRWVSGQKRSATGQIYTVPRIHSYNTVDLNIDKKITVNDNAADVYIAIQNVFNAQGIIAPGNTANPGLVSPTSGPGDMGRFFTIGIRGKL